MTQPDISVVLQALQATVTELKTAITELRRTVEGDTAVGAPSIRQAVRDLDGKHDALEARFDAFEEQRKLRDARLEGQWNTIKWLGGGSAITALGVIAALIKLFGGAP